MPNSLENQFIADTYRALLHTGSITLSSDSPKATIYSGDGRQSSLSIAMATSGVDISGDATITGSVIATQGGIFPASLISGSHTVTGNSNISGNMNVVGSLSSNSHTIVNNSSVRGSMIVSGTLNSGSHTVTGNSNISGNSSVGGNTAISGTLSSGSHTVTGNSNISGNSSVRGNTAISGALNSGSHTVTGDSNITGKITTNEIYADTYLNLPAGDTREDLINHIYPVGSIYLSFANVNPGVRFTNTIWDKVADGRFLVGVGTGNDGTKSKTFAAGNTVGEYEHKLTVAELPAHSHKVYNNSGSVSDSGEGDAASPEVGKDGTSAAEGGNQFHENTPPGFGVYVWQRIS